MGPGWRRVCTCGGVELDHFCEECMAFRSEARPHVPEVHVKVTLDGAKVAKAVTRRSGGRGGTLGH